MHLEAAELHGVSMMRQSGSGVVVGATVVLAVVVDVRTVVPNVVVVVVVAGATVVVERLSMQGPGTH